MRRLFTLLIFAALFTPAAAHDHDRADHVLKDALTVSGRVDEVLPAEQLVTIITPNGVEMDVPLDNLLFYDDRQIGLDELDSGKRVYARMPAGILELERASQQNRYWITVDGEQFGRIQAEELDKDILEEQQVTTRYGDGCHQDSNATEALRQEARELLLVQQ
ncbi:MAG: hypothetical protein AB7S38_11315 [Vulcanimicrobiota bacterium]